jgi:hypothetical protein
MADKDPDALEIRCPRLGGTVPFRYCMAPGEPAVCSKVLDCWWEVFDVVSHLKRQLSEEDFERVVQHRNPPNRMATILELVEKFRIGQEGGPEQKDP